MANRPFSEPFGGTAVSGGPLAPRSRRSVVGQADSVRRGGVSAPIIRYLLVGGGAAGETGVNNNIYQGRGGGGGGGYEVASLAVNAGTVYTVTVAGYSGGGGNPTNAFSTTANGGSSVNGGTGTAGKTGGSGGTNGGGGTGWTSDISGATTYYGGGGGGATDNGSGGGAGGGGNGGAAYQGGGSGAANTGGGGGGGGFVFGSGGGAGASGQVVIKYADSYAAANATTGSPSVTVSGGFRTYTFNGSGSITW